MNEGGIALLEGEDRREVSRRRLTDAEFQILAELPSEAEWLANINSPKTVRAYRADVREFVAFVGIEQSDEFGDVRRGHVIAWRNDLNDRKLAAATIRRKLSALSSLFDHLCDCNAVTHNPVDGVRRPGEGSNEGKTPAISDAQARALLDAPSKTTLGGVRDRAILSAFLFHGLRCEELCKLTVADVQERRGVKFFRVHGKRDKIRFVPVHPGTLERIADYLASAGHGADSDGPLFRRVTPCAKMAKPLSGSAIYACIVQRYARHVCIEMRGFCTHSLRATAATNSLENEADIAKVQEWLGHASIATTRLYDRRNTRPEDSPTFKVAY
jgi:site-specific recombinase XerD